MFSLTPAFARLLLLSAGSSVSQQVIDQQTFEDILPYAYAWASSQEQLILASGTALGSQQVVDAQQVGVQDWARVRVLVADRIPLPDNKELADAAQCAQIITDASRGVAIGHGIILRADCWGDRELLLHNLVHVAQCERSGGLEQWVREYLCDRRNCAKFTIGPLEAEARGFARKICTADEVAMCSSR
ncbi:MAG: hypothetical protein ABI925_00515 [Verrucomicrobiota bacterium]